jgi:uncharacterized membrane protein
MDGTAAGANLDGTIAGASLDGTAAGAHLDGSAVDTRLASVEHVSGAGPVRRFARGMLGRPARHLRRYFATLSVGGMIVALTFFCFSMTPSLLPRPWYLQGVAGGIAAVTGYAIGAAVVWMLRGLGFRPLARPHRRRLVLRVLSVAAIILIPLFGVLGASWQHQVRSVTHAQSSDPNFYALVLLIAFALGRAVLALARLLRIATRRIGRFAARWVPVPIAKLLAVVLVATVVVTGMADVLAPGLLAVTNAGFSTLDNTTAPDVRPPLAAERSGSPSSLVRWSDLGREGRTFIGSGPSATDIAAFRGAPAKTPIRVYAGIKSANGLAAEADLVVRELERTGAFGRSVLVVATTTGRGWVNGVAASAIEYMWGGDTAIAAMQYSFLPSPVAFLSDRRTPPQAGTLLFEAVHRAWSQLDAGKRPKLIVMGESLGSYGGQAAFGSIADVTSQADGAVWAGTPNFTPLWQTVTARRDPGSPQQIPTIGHCATVCFVAGSDKPPPGAHPAVVYLQHVNDPIVWWSPDLLFQRPEWLAEPAPPGRTTAMTYIPLVTFWQVTVDLVFSTNMPHGYGHTYTFSYANAFAAVVPPPGWDDADTVRLRNLLAADMSGA